jgi:hypothetical protein
MLDLFSAIVLATAGQLLLSRHNLWGLVPYGLSVAALPLVLRREAQYRNPGTGPGDFDLAAKRASTHRRLGRIASRLRAVLLVLAAANAVIAYVGAAGNTYRTYGVAAWLLAIVLFLASFWQWDPHSSLRDRLGRFRSGLRLSWPTLAVLGLILVGFFFRFWHLNRMPSEMTSDHIEKLLDVHDLVTGQRPIFFVRNTGREPWQFYWTLLFIRLFDLETKYFALKLGTAAIGLLTLPGLYLLGRELFNRRVGVWALLFGAVASWPVILSRIGLRFPLAPAATVWSLLYLLRGLRDGRRNDFLLLGLWLGVGLYGYTAFRIMPLAVLLCWGVALAVRPRSLTVQPNAFIRNGLLTVLIACIVFIPLGRYSLEHPERFWQRSASRIADPNQPIPDGPILTLLTNLRDLSLMFHWQGDDVWVNTLADEPVLDPLLGGLFLLGLVVAAWRAIRLKDAVVALLLLAGFLLLLPSALSLAYAVENPSVVRAGGAIPVVMVVAALPLGLQVATFPGTRATRTTGRRNFGFPPPGWRGLAFGLAAASLAVAVTSINYERYFGAYWRQYQRNALNTVEIASAIHGFAESGGSLDNAWIVAWPYWIDTRGVGIELGDPPWNNVILDKKELNKQAEIAASGGVHSDARPRLYVLHREDRATLNQIRALFPTGWSSRYRSQRPNRDFVLYYVPRVPDPSRTERLKDPAYYAQ